MCFTFTWNEPKWPLPRWLTENHSVHKVPAPGVTLDFTSWLPKCTVWLGDMDIFHFCYCWELWPRNTKRTHSEHLSTLRDRNTGWRHHIIKKPPQKHKYKYTTVTLAPTRRPNDNRTMKKTSHYYGIVLHLLPMAGNSRWPLHITPNWQL